MTTTPEAYVFFSEDQKTLTFFYDTLRADCDGTVWRIRGTKDDYDWTANLVYPSTIVLTAVFDASFRDFRPTTTAGWFKGLRSLKSIEGFENLNTSQVTDMSQMFADCQSLKALDLSNFDTAKVTDMSWMFAGCQSLTALDLSSFNTAKVTNTNGMFFGCDSLTALDLSRFDTSKMTDMKGIIEYCDSLTDLDPVEFLKLLVEEYEGDVL